MTSDHTRTPPNERGERLWPTAPPELLSLLELATDLAWAAGAVHREGRHVELLVEKKSSPTDHVSQVDREAERSIVERLGRERAADAILAEEGGCRAGTSGVRWIIDPLDGTTNYIYGYPAYAVSIAVEVEGIAEIGVVYNSATDRLYRAIRGFGAFCNGERLRARRPAALSEALVATGFSYSAEQRAQQSAALARILPRIRDIRRGGSAALDLCHLASGAVDAYWELDLSRWDYAAGCVIAREAGAELSFARAAHGSGPAVVGAHPNILPSLLSLLTEAKVLI